MKKKLSFTLSEMIVFMVSVSVVVGWVMNIYFLTVAVRGEVWAEVMLRMIGVFMFLFGCVLGYITFFLLGE